jgi:MFS family permease
VIEETLVGFVGKHKETSNENRKKLVGPTILSVSLLTIMVGAAVAPAFADIVQAYSGVSPAIVNLILTLPSLMVIPSTFIASRLAESFDRKNILLAGLVIYLIGGVAGGFAKNIYTLLIFRGLLGISVGLIMPISTSLVSVFYHGSAATKMMGWISAANYLGATLAQMISGLIATISWRYAFFSYGFALIVIVMVCIYLPRGGKTGKKVRRKLRLPVKVHLYSAAMFALMVVFFIVPMNISLLIKQNNMGGAAVSGLACSLISGAAFLVGTYFQRIKDSLNGFSVLAGIMFMAIAQGLLYYAGGIVMVFTGVTLAGLAGGYLMPYLLHSTRVAVGEQQSVKAMSVITCMLYLGQFCSPLILDFIGAFSASHSDLSPYGAAFGLSVGTAFIAAIYVAAFGKRAKLNRLSKVG